MGIDFLLLDLLLFLLIPYGEYFTVNLHSIDIFHLR